MAYTKPTITGYNTSPPSDDGSETEDNKVKWSTIKGKITDPVKVLAEALGDASETAWNDLASTATDDGTKGFHLVYYPLTSLESTNAITPTKYEYAPGDIRRYGAVFDAGVTDNTTAIQNAFDSGHNVIIPPVDAPATEYYKVTAAITLGHKGQHVYGFGWKSIIRQTTANLNVIEGSSLDDLHIERIRCYAVGSLNSINAGQGIYLNNCDKATVKNCFVENHRGKGIGLRDCEDCLIDGNILTNSPVIDGDESDTVQSDIGIYYSSKGNIISNNHCLSGQGIGITIQSITSGDDCSDNVVIGNVIDGSRMYGAQAYRLNGADTVFRNKFIGNTITNISGITSHPTDGKVFGAGVYIQAAEYSIVSGNTIDTTNASTVVDQLAPGAVGATNVSNVTITGNNISNNSWYGITVRDPTSQGIATGYGKIHDNNINASAKQAIHVVNRGRLSIRGNTLDGLSSNGIDIANTSAKEDCTISGNKVIGAVGSGIAIAYMDELLVEGNTCKDSSVSGITINNSDYVKIDNNFLKDNTTRGLQIASVCTNISANNNDATGNGTGMLIQSSTTLKGNNTYSNTTDWDGDYQILRTLGTGAATYDVANAVAIDVSADGTAIDNLTGGVDGQRLRLLATGIRTFNDTSGGAGQLILEGTLTTAVNDALILEFWGSAWYEVSRSINST